MDEFDADQFVSNFLGSEVCIKLVASKNQKRIQNHLQDNATIDTHCQEEIHEVLSRIMSSVTIMMDSIIRIIMMLITVKIYLQIMAKVMVAMQSAEDESGRWLSCGYDFDCMMRILASLCQ